MRVAVLGVDHGLRIVGGILDRRRHLVVQVLVGAAAQRRQRLVAGDREQPGRNLGLGLEALGLPPHVEEHLAHEVLGQRLDCRSGER